MNKEFHEGRRKNRSENQTGEVDIFWYFVVFLWIIVFCFSELCFPPWKFLPSHTSVFLILGNTDFRSFWERTRFTDTHCQFLVHHYYEVGEKGGPNLGSLHLQGLQVQPKSFLCEKDIFFLPLFLSYGIQSSRYTRQAKQIKKYADIITVGEKEIK